MLNVSCAPRHFSLSPFFSYSSHPPDLQLLPRLFRPTCVSSTWSGEYDRLDLRKFETLKTRNQNNWIGTSSFVARALNCELFFWCVRGNEEQRVVITSRSVRPASVCSPLVGCRSSRMQKKGCPEKESSACHLV